MEHRRAMRAGADSGTSSSVNHPHDDPIMFKERYDITAPASSTE
jgi:hypothetical protein